MKRLLVLLERSALVIVLVAAWQVLGAAGTMPSYLSTPLDVALALAESAHDGELWPALGVSLMRAFAGFLIGMIGGLIAGLAAGTNALVRNFFDPIVSFLFAVPKIAFLPVFLLLMGIGEASKIGVIAFSCFFPVFIAARHAILSVDRLILWTARNMGASPRRIFFRVLLPASAPQLFAGLRIALAHAFVVLFGAELIGSRAGLGVFIKDGEDAARFDIMLAGIVCFGLLGFLADRILLSIRARVVRGQTIGTEEAAGP